MAEMSLGEVVLCCVYLGEDVTQIPSKIDFYTPFQKFVKTRIKLYLSCDC